MELANLPTVCIVGRPNVGKSTLFNRIIGKPKAVVGQTSGTTRDSIEAWCERGKEKFRLLDTGGLLKTSPDKISSLVKKKIEEAILEAEILLFVCDAMSGVVSQDEEIVPILRKSNKKVFLVVNKVDNKKLEAEVYDFYRLGLGNPYSVSAIHGLGIGKLIDDLSENLKEKGGDEKKVYPAPGRKGRVYKIAITGRPNVGKSFFLNTLLKKERVIVDEIPGTTRDSIDTYFKKEDNLYLLIDTAGIRDKRKVKTPVDFFSMSRSKEAIKQSDVSFWLIDGYEGLRNDDVRIFNFIIDSGKCCILVVNKWDLVKNIEMSNYKKAIIRKTPTAAFYPIVFTSAKTGRNVLSCLDIVKEVVLNASQNIETNQLNRFLLHLKSLSMQKGYKNPKPHYMVQTSIRPPQFLIFVNSPKSITQDYTNFVENALRKRYIFFGTPIKIEYRRKR